MRDYTINYKDGKTKEIEVVDKSELIEILFEGSEKKLKAEVKSLQWRTLTLFFVEDVATGDIQSQMVTADTNPYGWRNEADN